MLKKKSLLRERCFAISVLVLVIVVALIIGDFLSFRFAEQEKKWREYPGAQEAPSEEARTLGLQYWGGTLGPDGYYNQRNR